MKKVILGIFLVTGLFARSIPADVETPSGSYVMYVQVSGNTVDCVQWDNGGCMSVFGAVFNEDGFAYGQNRKGQSIEIQVDKGYLR